MDVVSTVCNWFDQKVMSAARQIDRQDFSRAKKLWKERRNRRPLLGGSLSEALGIPDAFADRNIQVWIWKQKDLSKQEKKKIAAMRNERANKRIDGYGLEQNEKSPPPGTVIIEFDYDARCKKFKFIEATHILQDNPIQKLQSGKVALCLPAPKETRTVRKNLTRWESAANGAVPREDDEWFGPLHKFCRYLSEYAGARQAG